MNGLNKEIEQQLRNENADFVHFVDISMLNIRQNRGFPYALLIGIAINPYFIKTVHDSQIMCIPSAMNMHRQKNGGNDCGQTGWAAYQQRLQSIVTV